MSARKQHKKAKLTKLQKIKHFHQDFIVRLDEKDKPVIIEKMRDVWVNDDIDGDLTKHFSRPNISVGIRRAGEIRAFLLITMGSDRVASGTAVYTDGSMYYKRKLYKVYKQISNKLEGYKLYYHSRGEIFANHTNTDGRYKWVDL